MKYIFSLAILCMSFVITAYSQTTEPTALRFNWGVYTAPFHDSSHKITKPVLGWQWGANDSFLEFFGKN